MKKESIVGDGKVMATKMNNSEFYLCVLLYQEEGGGGYEYTL